MAVVSLTTTDLSGNSTYRSTENLVHTRNARIVRQEVRAEITFGKFTIRTPDVVSFSVQRARGQASAQFSASVKVDSLSISSVNESLGSTIVINAGFKGALKTIFTGTIYKCTFNPVKQDASKVMLNLAGKDVMGVLEGQKITRRTRNYKDGDSPPERWGVITGIVRHNTPARKKLKAQLVDTEPLALPVSDVNFPVVRVKTKDNELYRSEINKDIPSAASGLTVETVQE